MNKKLLAALALAAVGIGYLALQPKGDIPATVSDERPVTTNAAEEKIEPAPGQPIPADEPLAPDTAGLDTDINSENNNLVGKLMETLHADKELAEVALIQSVECADGKCTVELEAKGERNVQTTMMNFLQEHPEYGTNVKIAQGENPRVTQFTFGKEKL